MSELDDITAADTARRQALDAAIAAIETLQQASGEVPDTNDPTVAAFQRQVFADLDSNFWGVGGQALTAIQSNKAYSGMVPLTPRLDIDNGFAYVDRTGDPNLGITFCKDFFDTEFECQREVITHEYFHFVCGLVHYYGTTSTQEALACPHHLSQLVFDIALGEAGGCDDGATCF